MQALTMMTLAWEADAWRGVAAIHELLHFGVSSKRSCHSRVLSCEGKHTFEKSSCMAPDNITAVQTYDGR